MKRVIRCCIALLIVLSLSTQVFASTPFQDVPADAWFAESVEYVYSRGMMNGVSDTHFDPAGKMNRAMVVTVLYRMEGEPAVYGDNPFEDVPEGTWYTDAVVWAYENGIANGVSETSFDPEAFVLREQLVAFAYRYVDYSIGAEAPTEDLSGFTDVGKISAYAREAFAWANENGIVQGVTDTRLEPLGDSNRAQCAVILRRLDRFIANGGEQPLGDRFSADDWRLWLVNRDHPLAGDLDLKLKDLRDGFQVDIRCYPDLQEMMDDCRAAGLEPLICSAYRTMEEQEYLFERKVNQYIDWGYSRKEAEELAATVVAIPGTSEHQVGLAVDIVDESYQWLDEEQENMPAQKWLMRHSWEYGFILRYPNEKSDITGIIYEPWHYRYVGKEAAREIYERDICLEEFLELLNEP